MKKKTSKCPQNGIEVIQNGANLWTATRRDLHITRTGASAQIALYRCMKAVDATWKVSRHIAEKRAKENLKRIVNQILNDL